MQGMDKIKRWLDRAPDRMQRANQAAAKKLANEATQHARDLIRTQMFVGASIPLSPLYLRKKRRNKDQIFIHTGTMLRLIMPHPVMTHGWDASWDVGVLPNTYVNDINYGMVVNVLELGTRDGRVPARPLWGQVQYHITTIYDGVIMDQYRRAGLIA